MENSRGVKLLVFMIVILGLAYGGFYFILEHLVISNISIEGNQVFKTSDLLEEIELSEGHSIVMLYFNKNKIKDKLEENPYIKVQSIDIILPEDIIISIEERKESAYINYNDTYLLLGDDGIILDLLDDIKDYDKKLIEIKGLEAQPIMLGHTLDDSLSRSIEDIIFYLKEIDSYKEVDLIDARNKDHIELVLRNETRVLLGSPFDLEDKIIWLSSQEIREVYNSYSGGVLDLRSYEKPVFNIADDGDSLESQNESADDEEEAPIEDEEEGSMDEEEVPVENEEEGPMDEEEDIND